jgi:hypothetical protein
MVGLFETGVSQTLCLELALNCNPLNLCLLSSEDYRCEQSVPGMALGFLRHGLCSWAGLEPKILLSQLSELGLRGPWCGGCHHAWLPLLNSWICLVRVQNLNWFSPDHGSITWVPVVKIPFLLSLGAYFYQMLLLKKKKKKKRKKRREKNFCHWPILLLPTQIYLLDLCYMFSYQRGHKSSYFSFFFHIFLSYSCLFIIPDQF